MPLLTASDEVKWANHYSSAHEILLVGEGDFSFSLSLAKSFGSASNIVATSLDRYGDVVSRYAGGKSNLSELASLGATLLHGVDVTKMRFHKSLRGRKFDRIVFNFPHAGFNGKEDDPDVLDMHRKLVGGFLRNACRMLRRPGGEVHVTHKTGPTFVLWDIPRLARACGLEEVGLAPFFAEDYPGYCNKRGDGNACDEPFPLGVCCTYMFPAAVGRKRRLAETGPPTDVKGSTGTSVPGSKRRLSTDVGVQQRTSWTDNYEHDPFQSVVKDEMPLSILMHAGPAAGNVATLRTGRHPLPPPPTPPLAAAGSSIWSAQSAREHIRIHGKAHSSYTLETIASRNEWMNRPPDSFLRVGREGSRSGGVDRFSTDAPNCATLPSRLWYAL